VYRSYRSELMKLRRTAYSQQAHNEQPKANNQYKSAPK
jgi:hypothetical protein